MARNQFVPTTFSFRRPVPAVLLSALLPMFLAACSQPETTQSTERPSQETAGLPAAPPPTAEELSGVGYKVEYGEYLAGPEELIDVPVNDIVQSLRLNAGAMRLGKEVFAKHCANCHGEDLKGIPEAHTPDLTDNVWLHAGDDLASGGATMYPSDVEWVVRYGIRSGDPYTKGFDVDMVAFDPAYRNARDLSDFGDIKTLTDAEVDDVVEYVLQISGQEHDTAMAARGAVLFQDNAKGNCFDCHGYDGAGLPVFGSANLTRPDLYLFGSDRASIRESIVEGRVGTMPGFKDTLSEAEIKAVAVFAFSRARH
jgi:cytochrome c oxidase cbb3-type subunit 3